MGPFFSLCYSEHNAGSIFSYFCFNCAQILPLVEAFESIKFDLVRKLSGLITYVLAFQKSNVCQFLHCISTIPVFIDSLKTDGIYGSVRCLLQFRSLDI